MDIEWGQNYQFMNTIDKFVEVMPQTICGLSKSDLKFESEYNCKSPGSYVTSVKPLATYVDNDRIVITSSNVYEETYTFYEKLTITHIPTNCRVAMNIASLDTAPGVIYAIKLLKGKVDEYYETYEEK